MNTNTKLDSTGISVRFKDHRNHDDANRCGHRRDNLAETSRHREEGYYQHRERALHSISAPACTLRRSWLLDRRQTKRSLDALAVPPLTGPLDYLRGKRVIVLADVQNLTASAGTFDRKFSYRRLAELLGVAASGCTLHAFFASSGAYGRRVKYFKARGYLPHVYPVHHVNTCRGTERRSNVDLLFAAIGGAEVMVSDADVVLLATGDGQLANDVALAIRMLPKTRGIATLSFAGATSNTLDARKNMLIDVNIEAGRDILISEGRQR